MELSYFFEPDSGSASPHPHSRKKTQGLVRWPWKVLLCFSVQGLKSLLSVLYPLAPISPFSSRWSYNKIHPTVLTPNPSPSLQCSFSLSSAFFLCWTQPRCGSSIPSPLPPQARYDDLFIICLLQEAVSSSKTENMFYSCLYLEVLEHSLHTVVVQGTSGRISICLVVSATPVGNEWQNSLKMDLSYQITAPESSTLTVSWQHLGKYHSHSLFRLQ